MASWVDARRYLNDLLSRRPSTRFREEGERPARRRAACRRRKRSYCRIPGDTGRVVGGSSSQAGRPEAPSPFPLPARRALGFGRVLPPFRPAWCEGSSGRVTDLARATTR